jgi:hypothetical protein
MAVDLENVNDAFPDRLAAECLFDRHRLGKRGRAAVLGFYSFFKLSRFTHSRLVFCGI